MYLYIYIEMKIIENIFIIKFFKFKRYVFLILVKVCWVLDLFWICMYLWKVFVLSIFVVDLLFYIVFCLFKMSKKLIKFVYYSEKEIFFLVYFWWIFVEFDMLLEDFGIGEVWMVVKIELIFWYSSIYIWCISSWN